MKLLLNKNNQSRFTMDYKLINDDESFDQNEWMLFGNNAVICYFNNVIFEDGVFEYQPITRKGIAFQTINNKNKQQKKSIFQLYNDQIINKFDFASTMNIQNNSVVSNAIFAYQDNIQDVDNVRKKFETNLRCQILQKIDHQIHCLMTMKSRLEF